MSSVSANKVTATDTSEYSNQHIDSSSGTAPPVIWQFWDGEQELNNWVQCFLSTPDGGYLVGGRSVVGPNSDNPDVDVEEAPYVVKYNSSGQREWLRRFEEYGGGEVGNRTEDMGVFGEGHYVAAFSSTLVVLNGEGEIESETQTPRSSETLAVTETGDIIISGDYYPFEPKSTVIRFSSNLEEQARYTIDRDVDIQHFTVISDTEFIVTGDIDLAGDTPDSEEQQIRAYVARLRDGNTVWSTHFDIEEKSSDFPAIRCTGAQPVPDSEDIILCGNFEIEEPVLSGGETTGFTARVSKNELEWLQIYNPTIGMDTAHPTDETDRYGLNDLVRVDDDTFIAAGEYTYREEDPEPDQSTRVLAFNSDGDVLWDFVDHVPQGHYFSGAIELEPTPDGGVVVGGYTSVPGSTVSTWVFKLGVGPTFQPENDGCGFRNWATDSEDPTFDPPHNHERISREEIREITSGWEEQLPSQSLSEPMIDHLSTDAYENINSGTATGGHCFGMVKAAQLYYRTSSALPSGVTQASEVPRPTGEYQSVGDDIDRYHNRQFLDFSTWWTARILRLPNEIASIDYDTQLDRITSAIDQGRTIGIALGNSFETRAHQVLAYDYEEQEEETDVFVYDPNYRAEAYTGVEPFTITFDTSGSEVTVSSGHEGYERLKTLPQDSPLIQPGQEKDPGEHINDGTQGSLDGLFDEILRRMISFQIFSPVSIEVECPDGEVLSTGPTDLISETATDADATLTRLAAPAGEYSIRLVGEDSGEYDLRVSSVTPAGTVIDTEVSGEIEQDQTHEFTATIPQDGDGATLTSQGNVPTPSESGNETSQGDGGNTQSPGSDSSGSDDTESGTSDDGTNLFTLGLVGGGAALAGATGWLKYRDSDN